MVTREMASLLRKRSEQRSSCLLIPDFPDPSFAGLVVLAGS